MCKYFFRYLYSMHLNETLIYSASLWQEQDFRVEREFKSTAVEWVYWKKRERKICSNRIKGEIEERRINYIITFHSLFFWMEICLGHLYEQVWRNINASMFYGPQIPLKLYIVFFSKWIGSSVRNINFYCFFQTWNTSVTKHLSQIRRLIC